MELFIKYDIILLNFEFFVIKWIIKFLIYIGVVVKGYVLFE